MPTHQPEFWKQPPGTDFEIVIGLVYLSGTNYEDTILKLKEYLRGHKFVPHQIRLSDCLTRIPDLGAMRATKPPCARIAQFMDAGNKARKKMGMGSAVALLGIAEIAEKRKEAGEGKWRNAYIIHSLKHPDEVLALRDVYGPGFFLLGLHASEHERLEHLKSQGMSDAEAHDLVLRDKNEGDGMGQHARETFSLADAFIRRDSHAELSRFVDLIFGDPFLTPTQDEAAMYSACAASARSSDLSRQVGAAIFSPEGELLSIGTNDVPCYGGGLYWPNTTGDMRDFKKEFDSNHQQREEIVRDLERRLDGVLTEEGKKHLGDRLKGSKIFDITEYGRAVHAEMEALLSCARKGISPKGGILYSTTFPCHNCAKHIVGAGIDKIVYIEPYPKSQALHLHDDALHFFDSPPHKRTANAVALEPFVGIGPRRYFDLFSQKFGSGKVVKREVGGKKIHWPPETSQPKVPMSRGNYMDAELGVCSIVFETFHK